MKLNNTRTKKTQRQEEEDQGEEEENVVMFQAATRAVDTAPSSDAGKKWALKKVNESRIHFTLQSRAPCAKQWPLPGYYLRTEWSVGCSFRFHPPKGTRCSASHLSYHSAMTPSTMPLICELIKTQVHPIISDGFQIVHFTKTQERKFNSLIIFPSNARSTMWFKRALSYCNPLHKLQDNPAARLFTEELKESDEDRIPASTPEYTRSFATKIREAEERLGIVHDQQFSYLQLEEAAALDLLKRMDAERPHSPFLSNFNLDTEHPTRPDHHPRADPPVVIALRSRLRFDNTLLNSPLHKRKMKASPKCEHCGQPEAIKHAILPCSQYDSARSNLFAALGFRPPDNHLMDFCLSRTSDRKLKGRNLLPLNALQPRSS